MNELLNTINLPAFSAESPPGVIPNEGQSTGADGFAAMLGQLGQTMPPPVLPGIAEAGTRQGDSSAAAQAALLQLLNLVGLTGQQQAMDGSITGSLPINVRQGETALAALLQLLNSVGLTGQQQAMDDSMTGSLPIHAQPNFDLMSLNIGASPTETLMSARQLLASVIPDSTGMQPVVISGQQLSVGVPSSSGAEFRLPADLLLSSGDLAKLQSILTEALSTPSQSTAIQPDLPHATAATLPEMSSRLNGLEQLLKEKFPTLSIDNLSAQLNLKSPELARTVATPNALPEILASNVLSTKPANGESVSAILPQATQLNRSQVNGIAEALSSTALTDPNPTAATSSVVAPATPTVAAALTTLQIESKPHSNLTITPETIKTVQEGNLEKTAAKAVENASSYSQTAQHWTKLTSDQSDLPVSKQVTQMEEPPIEKTKFRIQFDRFQIDALLQRSEIKLQLHPTNLGSMRVKLVSTAQEVTARFETTSEAARIAVEQNLPQLRESLDKAGIKVDHVEVVLDEQRARQQQSHYQSQRKQSPDAEISANTAQPDTSESGGISTAVQSMLGKLNLLA